MPLDEKEWLKNDHDVNDWWLDTIDFASPGDAQKAKNLYNEMQEEIRRLVNDAVNEIARANDAEIRLAKLERVREEVKNLGREYLEDNYAALAEALAASDGPPARRRGNERDLYTSLPPGEKTMIWKNIETAPSDGTPVLLYSPDASEPQIFVGHYVDFEGDPEQGCWQDYWRNDGCWPIDAEVTHWMPLPDVPKV